MSRPLRIVRIIDRMNVGGPAIHVALTSDHLNDGKRFTTLLLRGEIAPGEGDMSYLLEGRNIRQQYLPSLGRSISPLNDLKVLWQVFRILRTEKPDVVHTHKSKAGLIGRMAAFLARVPVRIHTFHGHVFHGYFSPAVSKAVVLLERTLALITDRIFVVGDELKKQLVDRYRIAPAEKILVVPLGLDLAPLADAARREPETGARAALRKSLNLPVDRKLVSIVGRLTKIKNHDLFLETAKRVLASRPDTDFVIVGGGERDAELKALASKLGIAGHVHFLGFRSDTAFLYSALDLAVITSDNEGTPVTLIEAGAAGLPVVSTDVGAVRTVVRDGETGFVVPPGDAGTLADRIIRLLDDPALAQRLGAAGQRYVLANFSIEKLCETLGRLYNSLTEGKTR